MRLCKKEGCNKDCHTHKRKNGKTEFLPYCFDHYLENRKKNRKKRCLIGQCLNCDKMFEIPKNVTKKHYCSHSCNSIGNNIKIRYGFTITVYKAMLAAQDKKCAICKNESDRALCVDHDHITGKVRGLLCYRCNIGLGLFKDDVELLKRAIDYLNHTHSI